MPNESNTLEFFLEGDATHFNKTMFDTVDMVKRSSKDIKNAIQTAETYAFKQQAKPGGKDAYSFMADPKQVSSAKAKNAQTKESANELDELLDIQRSYTREVEKSEEAHEHLTLQWNKVHPFLLVNKQITGMLEFQTYSMLNLALHTAQKLKASRKDVGMPAESIRRDPSMYGQSTFDMVRQSKEKPAGGGIMGIGIGNLAKGGAIAAGALAAHKVLETVDEIIDTIYKRMHFLGDASQHAFNDMVKGAKSFEDALLSARKQGVDALADEITDLQTTHGIGGFFKWGKAELASMTTSWEAFGEGAKTVGSTIIRYTTFGQFGNVFGGKGAIAVDMKHRLEDLKKMREGIGHVLLNKDQKGLVVEAHTITSLQKLQGALEGVKAQVSMGSAGTRFKQAFKEYSELIAKGEVKEWSEHANDVLKKSRDLYDELGNLQRIRLLDQMAEAKVGKEKVGLEGVELERHRLLMELVKEERDEYESLDDAIRRVSKDFQGYLDTVSRDNVIKKNVDDIIKSTKDLNDENAVTIERYKHGEAAAQRLADQQKLNRQGVANDPQVQAEQAAKDRANLEKEGTKLLEQTIRPIEKYQRDLGKLDELKGKGIINEELYRRSLAKTRKEFVDTMGIVGSMTGVSARSVEALSMVAEYTERNAANLPKYSGTPAAAEVASSATKGTGAGAAVGKTNQLLQQIRDDNRKKVAVTIQPMGIT